MASWSLDITLILVHLAKSTTERNAKNDMNKWVSRCGKDVCTVTGCHATI